MRSITALTTTRAVPMGASAAVAAVLTGRRRAVTVAAVTPAAVYLATGDPDCPALCLSAPDAVRVPCALVVARIPATSAVGDTGTVGGGTVAVPGFQGRVARWWRPDRPRTVPAGRLRAALSGRVPAVPEAVAARTDLCTALAGCAPVDDCVRRLLGRGPGLTPVGDDVLAGALVTLGALGAPAFTRLGAAVRALAATRTTFVSAALLHHAARGECIPQLRAVLAGDAAAIDALLAVGATSGAGLAHGVLAALSAGTA